MQGLISQAAWRMSRPGSDTTTEAQLAWGCKLANVLAKPNACIATKPAFLSFDGPNQTRAGARQLLPQHARRVQYVQRACTGTYPCLPACSAVPESFLLLVKTVLLVRPTETRAPETGCRNPMIRWGYSSPPAR